MKATNQQLLRLCLASLISLSASAVSIAEEAHHSAEEHGEEHHQHSYHKNVLGVFGGITHAGRREKDPALGIEYERRITEHFGIGAVAEYTFGDHDFWIYAIPFAFHTGHWKFYVAPGIEESDEHGSEELVRLGVEYAFELSDGWEIAPQVNVDFVDSEDVWVFGFVFARGF